MKELRIKIDDALHDILKKEAKATDSFPAVIAKNALEEHYRNGSSGCTIRMSDYHIEKLTANAKKLNIKPSDYLYNLFEKLFVKGKYTIILNPSGVMSRQNMKSWLEIKLKETLDFLRPEKGDNNGLQVSGSEGNPQA